MDNGHPDHGAYLGRCRPDLRVADVSGLDAGPHRLLPAGPFAKPFDALPDEPDLAGHFRPIMRHRVDVEGEHVTSLRVFGIVRGAGCERPGHTNRPTRHPGPDSEKPAGWNRACGMAW